MKRLTPETANVSSVTEPDRSPQLVGRVVAGEPTRPEGQSRLSEPSDYYGTARPTDCFELTINDDSLESFGVQPFDRVVIDTGHSIRMGSPDPGALVCIASPDGCLAIGSYIPEPRSIRLPYRDGPVIIDARNCTVIGVAVALIRPLG